MKEQLQNIKEQALKTIGDCVDVKQLDELRVKYLGKKGELTAILKSMGKLSAEERPVMGQLANDVRQSLEGFIAQKPIISALGLIFSSIETTFAGSPWLRSHCWVNLSRIYLMSL